MVGTNDVAVPTCVRATPSSPALFKQHYNTLLQTVRRKYPNAAIFMHDLFPRYSSRRWQYRETNTQLLNFTKEFNTVLRGFCARGIANVFIAENFDNTVNFMGRYLSTDGLHLSEQGYNIMCLTLKQVISSYFSISPPSHVSYCSCSTICICHCHAINKTLAHHTVRDFTSALRFTWLGKRAVCYFGDVPYGYGSGNRTVYHDARSISESPLLSSIADEISRALPGVPFNSVLVNYYKDGSSYMPFHSDDEKCIAPNSTIISVSYGESRPFHFQRTGRHFHSKGSDNSVTLESGKIIVMSYDSQQHWRHSVPCDNMITGERINLTFRMMTDSSTNAPNWKKFQPRPDAEYAKILEECKRVIRDEIASEIKPKVAPDNNFLHTHPVDGMVDPELSKKVTFEYAEPPMTDKEYTEIVGLLNEKQREAFNMIDDHSTREAQGLENKQLIHFISGAGGCGKSFLIKALRHCINRKFPDGRINPRCIVTALTGAAAVVVDGQTVHTALNLDLQTGFFSKSDFKRIPAHKLDLMKDAVFNSVLYIIIDEVSMMGIDVLKHVNQRLHELKSLPSLSNQAFGGIHVIFCGDFYQLPPVMSRTVFSNTCSSLSQTVDLWKDHVTFTELTEVVRSKGDTDFTQLCHRVRVGIITDADMATLNARVIPAPSDSEILDDMKICYTNQECFNHNEKCIQLMRQSTTIHTFNSIDSFKSDQLNSTECLAKLMPNDPSKTAGLPKKLEICIGARIMIRVNVDTLDRIVNGVMGTVRFIDFSAKSKLPHVYVEFDDKSAGVKTGLKHEKCNFFCKKTLPCPKLGFVKIVPQEKDFISSVNKRTWVRRYQLPMVLSWATTVHKVQGLTVTNACVALHGHKPGVKWPPGAAYVELSRFQRLSDVRLSAFDRHQIRTCPMVAGEYDRLRKLPKFVNPYTNVHPLPKSLSQQLSPNNNDNLHGENHSNPNNNNVSPTCESSTPLPTDNIFCSPGIEILSQPIQSPNIPHLMTLMNTPHEA